LSIPEKEEGKKGEREGGRGREERREKGRGKE